MDSQLPTVNTFGEQTVRALLGNSKQATYLIGYLSHLKTQTFVIEKPYVDKDYLVDYQKFYCRSFEDKGRYTTRLHFFNTLFSEEEFNKYLEIGNEKDIDKLKSAYLGYVIIKPIQDKKGNWLLGRTLLKPYNRKEGAIIRHYLYGKGKSSLFGIDLQTRGVPFQTQDKGVSACATIALWTALQILNPLFKLQEKAPAEITEMSADHVSEARIFPQEGLTFSQMIKFVRASSLDIEAITVADKDVVVDVVRAYLHAGIPVIAALRMSKGDTVDYHAAVIVGYQCDQNTKVSELYVHDDQIGPYSRVKPITTLSLNSKYFKKDFRFWQNEWLDLYDKIQVEKLLVPIYHKIRMPWHTVYELYNERYKEAAKKNKLRTDLLLTTVQAYKRFLLKHQIRNKSKMLKLSLPKFIWIIRITGKNNKIMADFLFDGTEVNASAVDTKEDDKNLRGIVFFRR